MKKIAVLLFVFLVAAAGVGFLVTHGGGPTRSSGGLAVSHVGAAMPSAMAAPGSAEDLTLRAASAPAQAGAGATAGSASSTETFTPSTASVGPKVVKTADLTIQVAAKGFESAWRQANTIAQQFGGYVMSSSTSGNPARSGDLLIRIPSKNFDLAMNGFRGLGETQHDSVNGQDVTNQFIDLGARLKTWQAQENVLFRLMDKANSISETMTVQRQLQQVQYQIEQIKGQLRVLRDETSLATIKLTLHEPGVALTKPATSKPSLVVAWDRAVSGFLSVVALVIVGLGYLVPLSLIGLAVWAVTRKFRGAAIRTPVA